MSELAQNTMLTKELLVHGLIVFGQFAVNRQLIPYQVNLEYLPSYPTLMRRCVTSFVETYQNSFGEFIGSYSYSIPLASVVANETRKPHVFTFDINHAFVGSYDVGHDTTLIMLNYEGRVAERLQQLGSKAGLNIKETLCVFSIVPDIKHRSMFYMTDVVEFAVSERLISNAHAQAVRDFIHHQD